MLKLSKALSDWRPAQATASEPIVLLEAGWADIVGTNVARHCAPARIVAGTLLITTHSNAWSHQLSLLSEDVLHAVSARVPKAGVKRLRFRVGTVSQRRDTQTGRRHHRRIHSAGDRPETLCAADALASFRGEVDRINQVKRAGGWTPCAGCGVLVAPDAQERCAACAAAAAQAQGEAVARLLFEAPWLGYAGTASLLDGLQEEEYERIRSLLLTRWWSVLAQARAAKRLSRDGRERLIASSYVLLRSKIPPEEIIPATIRNILGDELHDLVYSEQQKK